MFAGSVSFFFFFAHFLINLDFISIGPQKSIKKKNEANIVETKNRLLISYRHGKKPIAIETNKLLCPSFFKMCLWNMNPI